jgi:hypothetical protein
MICKKTQEYVDMISNKKLRAKKMKFTEEEIGFMKENKDIKELSLRKNS